MKKLIGLCILCLSISIQAIAQMGALSGKVMNSRQQPVANAIIQLTQSGLTKGGSITDAQGNYTVKNIAAGRYDVKARATGYQPKQAVVAIQKGKTTTLNFTLSGSNMPVIEPSVLPCGERIQEDERKVISSDKIEKMPTRNTSSLQYANAGAPSAKASRGKMKDRSYAPSGVYQPVPPPYPYPNTESYKKNAENDFMTVKANPLSTLSVDVDRASYSNVRRFITSGQTPPADAVRVEEMINYFDYQYPQPKGADPISITTELTSCPWRPQHQLLHVGMQARIISTKNLPASNLVFLIDVSGSMSAENKLPLVISSMKLLVNNLRSKDRISIAVYAGSAGLVLPSTPGNQKSTIYAALDRLQAGGSTAGGAGIKLAYNIAVENFIEGGNNRVILATDGDFNVGMSGDKELEDLIVKERKKGVFLTCLGYGMGNYKDSKMEVLADKGNGNYSYIDNIMEAEKTLVNEFGGTLFTVAKDVKAQIEFNPTMVQGYRLVGYENRLLNEEDFKDDKKDAGDMGSGHTVTIIYEIIPTGIQSNIMRGTTPLKYQRATYPGITDVLERTGNGELATIKFRYKQPDADRSKEMTHVIANDMHELRSATENVRFATSVAMFGMLLKNSEYKGNSSYDNVLRLAKNSLGEDENGYRSEFIQLVKTVSNRTDAVGWNDTEEE